MCNSYNNKFTRQICSTVKQLMMLAEKDDCGGFLALAKKNKDLFGTIGSNGCLFEVAVTVGLMARNKTHILDKFIEKILPDKACLCSDIICHFAGILIRKRLCLETVKLFIQKLPKKPTTNYTLLSAVMMDDLEIFKLLYNLYNSETDYSIILLFCGIFKSKKILDHITDCGNDLLKNDISCKADFDKLFDDPLSLDNIFHDDDLFPDDDSFPYEDDILSKWLENIHSMYLSNEAPEKSYQILKQIAKNTNIDIDIEINDYINRTFFNSSDYNKIIMRKIFIMNICGLKTNDLTNFIPIDIFDPKIDKAADAIIKIAGDAPFVIYNEMIRDVAARLAKKLDNTLTVKLINNFNTYVINFVFHGTVRFEIDAEDPETAENLCNALKPGITLEDDVPEAIMYFIENGIITVEKMAEIATLAQNYDVVNMLFDYKNK